MRKQPKIQARSLTDLVNHKDNPRKHPQSQIKQLAKSITKNGFTVPIVIDDKNTILAGHGRVEAAKLAGLKKVPCVILAGFTEKEKYAYVVSDNRMSDLSDWNWDSLMAGLRGFAVDTEFDWDDIGFGDVDISELLSDVLPDEEDEPEPLEVVTPTKAFAPSTKPTKSTSEVSDKDLTKAEKKLEMDNSNGQPSSDLQVSCPSCLHEFVVRP